jgi:RNA polymerase sigma-70 factor, ECF subfamily
MERTILAEISVANSCNAGALDFDALVHEHGKFVFSVAYSVLRHSEEAEDIAQETFFKAFRAGNLSKIGNLRAWLGCITWRLALNRARNRSGNQTKIQSDDLLRTLPSLEKRADEVLIRKERTVWLERVLLSLPRDLQETFILMTVEEMTSRSAAEILGIPESSVRNRLFRARNMVKEKLAALMEGRR